MVVVRSSIASISCRGSVGKLVRCARSAVRSALSKGPASDRSALSDRTNADHRTSRSISARTRGAFGIATNGLTLLRSQMAAESGLSFNNWRPKQTRNRRT